MENQEKLNKLAKRTDRFKKNTQKEMNPETQSLRDELLNNTSINELRGHNNNDTLFPKKIAALNNQITTEADINKYDNKVDKQLIEKIINEQKQIFTDLAYKNARTILYESGMSQNDKWFSIRLYEMQFAIYNQLKLTHNIS